MALPQAVERAEALANEMYQQAYGTVENANPDPAPQGTPAPAPAAAEAPAAPQLPDAPEETWQSRFNTLNGKYHAEVPRLAAERRELASTVQSLTATVNDLKKQLDNIKSTQQESLVTPEEVVQFGEPLVDLARRVAQDVVNKTKGSSERELNEVRTELSDLKKSAGDIQWQNFIDLLTSIVPDWSTVNADADFLRWLDEMDTFSGAPRQALLDRARDARDAQRVALFFKTWKDANKTKAASSQGSMAQHAVPDSMARSVAPQGKPFFTRQSIQQFYSDWREGKLTDAVAIAKEAEIQAAVQEGRVR